MKRILLRTALPADLPIIQRMHAMQNERDGTHYELPRLFRANGELEHDIPVALIGHEDGETSQAIYVQAVPELLFAGKHAKATAFARRDIDALAQILRWRGYNDLYCRVPRGVVEHVRKPLEASGFRCLDDALVCFYKDLRVEESAG